MSSQKQKGKKTSSKDAQAEEALDVKAVRQLKAVVLADSFDEYFRPITFEKPRSLLPIVGVPLLKYTLEFLASSDIEEIIVFCCSKADQLEEYIDHLNKDPLSLGIPVKCIVNKDAKTCGDALREIKRTELIRDEFVLVFGDVISNIDLNKAFQDHLKAAETDKSTIMTMILTKTSEYLKKNVYSGPNLHVLRDQHLIGIDEDSNKILFFDSISRTKSISIDKNIFKSYRNTRFYNNLEESGIYICSPELLTVFTENFDFQNISQSVIGILNAEEADVMGDYTIYSSIVSDRKYTSRVSSIDLYHRVGMDILARYTHPLVPDNRFDGTKYTFIRDRYQESNVKLSRSCKLIGYTSIGFGTSIDDNTQVFNSTIGRNCRIGSNVIIKNSHIWDDVTIDNNVTIEGTIICNNSVIHSGSVLNIGCIISYNSIIGKNVNLPEFTRITSVDFSRKKENMIDNNENEDEMNYKITEIDLGEEGKGFKWSFIHENDQVEYDDYYYGYESDSDHQQEEESFVPEHQRFKDEIAHTIERALTEPNISDSDLMHEINSLKFAYNKTVEDCAIAVFTEFLKNVDRSQILQSIGKMIEKSEGILKTFTVDVKSQTELIFGILEFFQDEDNKKDFERFFRDTLYQLYDKEILSEESLFEWEDEIKEGGDEDDKKFYEQCKEFLDWLREEDEEDEEDEDDEDDQ